MLLPQHMRKVSAASVVAEITVITVINAAPSFIDTGITVMKDELSPREHKTQNLEHI